MKKIIPVKRSDELKPLSHDHHDGLLFVWKLRQGVQRQTEPERIVPYISWYWSNHLMHHFEEEERVLPAFLPAGDTMLTQMMEEHIRIRELLELIEKNPQSLHITTFAGMLYDHIRFEERKFFPSIEERLPAEQLQALGRELHALTPPAQACDPWKDEFWVRKG